MYPSNTSGDASFFHFSEANSISTNEGFLNYFPPSPLINYDDAPVFYQHLHNIIHQNGDQEVASHEITSNCNSKVEITDDKFCTKSADKKESSCEGADNIRSRQIRINRRCKKDRHSKIITANGSSRGRRMRLSIDVAKDFFALQDMLGNDKASKTVEWLMIKSENAIREVKKNCVTGIKRSSSPSSTSVLSAIDELEAEVTTKQKMIIREKGSRKIAALLHPLTRKSREKARARARERTQKKKRLQLGGFGDDESKLLNILQENAFGSAYNPLLGCIKSTAAGNNIRTMNPSNPAPSLDKSPNYIKQAKSRNFEGNIISREGLIDDSLFITENWNPFTIVTHHQNSETTSYNEHQVTDFQYDGKNMGDI